MEVHKLNAALNWDSKFDANPWDLNFADIDLAMRCYPTDSLQIPINLLQLDGQRGYSIGAEYSYDLFLASHNQQNNPSHNNNDVFNRYYRMHEEDDDMEQMQREQEDEFQWEWNSFYEQFSGGSSGGGAGSSGSTHHQKFHPNSHGQDFKGEEQGKQQQEKNSGTNYQDSYYYKQQEQYQQHERYEREQREFEEGGSAGGSARKFTDEGHHRSEQSFFNDTRSNARRDEQQSLVPVAQMRDLLYDVNRKSSFSPNRMMSQQSNSMESFPHSIVFQDARDLVISDHEVEEFGSEENEGSYWRRKLADFIDLKSVQGIFKVHVQKPYISSQQQQQQQRQQDMHHTTQTMDADESMTLSEDDVNGDLINPRNMVDMSLLSTLFQFIPQTILMNHLSMIFGNNKICANLGFNTRSTRLSSKLMCRRKFFIAPLAKRPLYVTASVINPQSANRIGGISAAIRSIAVQYRRFNGRNAISLSKRSYYTPFSKETRKRYLEEWKRHYEQEEVIQLPPPPVFTSALPPEMLLSKFHSDESGTLNTSDITYRSIGHIIKIVIRYFDTLRNIVHQVSKALRYFIDIQIATAESSIRNYWPINVTRYKSLFLSRFYEQLYLFSMGPRSRLSIEYSWKRMEDYSFSNVYRVPVETNWGCDLFRVWLFLDLYAESCQGKWKHDHNTTVAVTLFDVYTLFSYTISLNPLLQRLTKFFKFIKLFLLGYIK